MCLRNMVSVYSVYTALFWIGFLISIASHTMIVSQYHTTLALTGTIFMFLGSKIGREFLGLV